jgi:enoyl-CoA hydratase/carnithine racemase
MSKVEYRKDGYIGFIVLNRPEVKNAIDREMVDMLDALWRDFESDQDIRVGILAGAGENFCSGYDIRAINERQEKQEAYTWNRSSMFGDKRIGPDGHGVTKPIITVLDGHVNGAGVWLAFQGDIRIATGKARFGLGEARFNFPVEFSAFILKHLPRPIAMEMLFSLKIFSSQRFLELGVLNEIVEEERLMKRAEEIAKELLSKGPLALRAMKKILNFDPDYDKKVEISKEWIVPVVNSEDTKEAVRATIEKRKPEWKLK